MKTTPVQDRARQSEDRCLEALNSMLQHQSFSHASIRQIAEMANLSPSAVIKRFGSKTNLLLALFERFCDDVMVALTRLGESQYYSLNALCEQLSIEYEQLLTAHWPANRGMNELFMEDLTVHPLTAGIFKATCDVLLRASQDIVVDKPPQMPNAFSAAQLLVTLNYNYQLGAMPALPAENPARHSLIASLMVTALMHQQVRPAGKSPARQNPTQ